MKELEILAPAGNMENLQTAINCGANAVYLGLQNFNARMSAQNFTTENIGDVVRYCHSLGVKVYVTVNTLVSNDEMSQMVETVMACVDAKVDAYLVQDLGVFNVLKNCFPGICLHASTQLGIHNLEGAKMAEKLGFSRVVLSREAKLSDVKEIKENTSLEIEFFVQGALCIAFSGNCYFSGMVLGESGNRGRCKQFCRMKYKTSEDGEESYLLSARDLCLLKNLKALVDAGVQSFKIEGRLRHAGYVAQSVTSYRKALDAILEDEKFDIESEKQKLKKVFSRGDFLEDAYLQDGTPDNVVNKMVQNHSGVFIGKVLKTEKFKDLFRVTIQSAYKISAGDGLKFFENGNEVASVGVGNVDDLGNGKYQIYTKRNIKPKLDVNLILDSEMEKKLLEKTKKQSFSAKIFANANKPLKVLFNFGGKEFEFESSVIPEKAKTAALTNEDIISQFSKLGGTIFEAEKIEVESDDVFIPKSVLNNFRREALEFLTQQIINENEKSITTKIDDEQIKNYDSLLKSVETNLEFSNIIVVNEHNQDFVPLFKNTLYVFSPQVFGVEQVENFKQRFKGYKVGLELPNLASNKDVLLIKKILDSNKDFYVIANNLYGLSFCDTHKVIAGTQMNVFNNYSISFLKTLGVFGFVISIEQQKENIKGIENYFVYSLGFVSLMTFAHCPYKTVNGNTCKNCSYKAGLNFYDVKNNAYKIYRYQLTQCYFSLLHSHLINNIGYVSLPQYLNLNGLTENQIKLALTGLQENKKVTLSSKDIFGKLNKQVK